MGAKKETGKVADTGLEGRVSLWRNIFYKRLVLMKRYWVNTASQLLTLYILFAVVFFGGKSVAGPTIEDSIGGIIVGFFLFTMSISAYSSLAWDMTREAQWGTLEQLYMSPFGFNHIIVAKSVINVLMSFLWGAIILALMILTSGKMVHIDVMTVVPLVVLTLASVVGIGFVFGGLALIYKRIENIFQIVQFGFLGLIAAPVDTYPMLKLLPISHGSYLMRQAMENGVGIREFGLNELSLLVGTSAFYFVLGYLIFGYTQRKAREKGVLGHY